MNSTAGLAIILLIIGCMLLYDENKRIKEDINRLYKRVNKLEIDMLKRNDSDD